MKVKLSDEDEKFGLVHILYVIVEYACSNSISLRATRLCLFFSSRTQREFRATDHSRKCDKCYCKCDEMPEMIIYKHYVVLEGRTERLRFMKAGEMTE